MLLLLVLWAFYRRGDRCTSWAYNLESKCGMALSIWPQVFNKKKRKGESVMVDLTWVHLMCTIIGIIIGFLGFNLFIYLISSTTFFGTWRK